MQNACRIVTLGKHERMGRVCRERSTSVLLLRLPVAIKSGILSLEFSNFLDSITSDQLVISDYIKLLFKKVMVQSKMTSVYSLWVSDFLLQI